MWFGRFLAFFELLENPTEAPATEERIKLRQISKCVIIGRKVL